MVDRFRQNKLWKIDCRTVQARKYRPKPRPHAVAGGARCGRPLLERGAGGRSSRAAVGGQCEARGADGRFYRALDKSVEGFWTLRLPPPEPELRLPATRKGSRVLLCAAAVRRQAGPHQPRRRAHTLPLRRGLRFLSSTLPLGEDGAIRGEQQRRRWCSGSPRLRPDGVEQEGSCGRRRRTLVNPFPNEPLGGVFFF